MIADRRLPSSLTRLIVGMSDPAWRLEQDAHAARSTITRKFVAAEGWSAVLKQANDLAALAKSEIARANRTSTDAELAIYKWKKKTGIADPQTGDIDPRAGVDPIKFYALTLYYEWGLVRRGGVRQMNAAREHALLFLRPDLFLEGGVFASAEDVPQRFRFRLKSLEQRRLRKERRRLAKMLKSMIEKPPRALVPLLANAKLPVDSRPSAGQVFAYAPPAR